MYQAQDTFNMDLPDGSKLTVTKGQFLPDLHAAVLHDAGRGILFKLVQEPEPAPAKRPRGRPRKPAVAAVADDDADGEEEEEA